MKSTNDLSGKRCGTLTVVKKLGSGRFQRIYWLCKCDCGNEKILSTGDFNSGHYTSCGCLKGQHISQSKMQHGLCGTRIHSIHRDMLARCYNPHKVRYERYGGRGITVCDEWRGKQGLKHFYEWAIQNGYSDDLTIDRINFDGNYEPSNCRWVTMQKQNCNTSRNINITLDGETHCLAEWCEIKGLNYPRVYQRIYKLKWDYERALTQ